jgi:hypothetical protein
MAYTPANLGMLVGNLGGGVRYWDYNAGADTQAQVRFLSYFTDGAKRGMLPRDIIFVRYTSNAASIHVVVTATRGAPGVNDTVDITDGLAIPATNTD